MQVGIIDICDLDVGLRRVAECEAFDLHVSTPLDREHFGPSVLVVLTPLSHPPVVAESIDDAFTFDC